MKRPVKYQAFALALAVCVGSMTSLQCHSPTGREGRPPSKEQETIVVDVRVVDVVQPPDEAWKDFRGVLRCVVLDPRTSGLAEGRQLNVVAARPEAAKKGMFVHRGSDLPLEEGAEYTISVQERLPKGWQPIQDGFADERIGLAALVALEKLDRPGTRGSGRQ